MTSDLEKYYTSTRVGSLACISRTDPVYGKQYLFTRVLRSSIGQIRTLFGTFWAINGERIDNRWNGTDNRLVVPTLARIEAEEANLTSIYQFGTDRRFELAAARAVLERRATKMPNVPPPPIPTLEEAEAELHEATIYWMNVDEIVEPPGSSIRARKEASERLAAARTNFRLAKKMRNMNLKRPTDSEGKPIFGDGHNESKQSSSSVYTLVVGLSLDLGQRYKYVYNSIDAASYNVNTCSVAAAKCK